MHRKIKKLRWEKKVLFFMFYSKHFMAATVQLCHIHRHTHPIRRIYTWSSHNIFVRWSDVTIDIAASGWILLRIFVVDVDILVIHNVSGTFDGMEGMMIPFLFCSRFWSIVCATNVHCVHSASRHTHTSQAFNNLMAIKLCMY